MGNFNAIPADNQDANRLKSIYIKLNCAAEGLGNLQLKGIYYFSGKGLKSL